MEPQEAFWALLQVQRSDPERVQSSGRGLRANGEPGQVDTGWGLMLSWAVPRSYVDTSQAAHQDPLDAEDVLLHPANVVSDGFAAGGELMRKRLLKLV